MKKQARSFHESDNIRCTLELILYVIRYSVENAKRSFYRASDGIFAKVGRPASEEVVVQLLKHKC